jgi:lipoprotein signal peptidase
MLAFALFGPKEIIVYIVVIVVIIAAVWYVMRGKGKAS